MDSSTEDSVLYSKREPRTARERSRDKGGFDRETFAMTSPDSEVFQNPPSFAKLSAGGNRGRDSAAGTTSPRRPNEPALLYYSVWPSPPGPRARPIGPAGPSVPGGPPSIRGRAGAALARGAAWPAGGLHPRLPPLRVPRLRPAGAAAQGKRTGPRIRCVSGTCIVHQASRTATWPAGAAGRLATSAVRHSAVERKGGERERTAEQLPGN